MKQNRISHSIVLTLSMLVASCTAPTDAESQRESAVIDLMPRIEESTSKAALTQHDDFKQFGIFTYSTAKEFDTTVEAPDYMNNYVVNYVDGAWNYGETMFWPADLEKGLLFYGYAPYIAPEDDNDVMSVSATSSMQIEYTLPTAAEDQIDLLTSDVHMQFDGEKIPLTFRHSMAAIAFKTRGFEGKKIKEVSLVGVIGKSTLVVDSSGAQTWTDSEIFDGKLFKASIYDNITPQAEDQVLTKDDGYLLMIPQELNDKTRIKVVLKDDKTNLVEFVYFNVGSIKEWERNMIYNYCILVNDEIIELDPDIVVTPWNKADDQTVAPYDPDDNLIGGNTDVDEWGGASDSGVNEGDIASDGSVSGTVVVDKWGNETTDDMIQD